MAVLERGTWYPDKEENDLMKVDSFHKTSEVEANRYHLYISLACPFAHRPFLVINYLGLNDVISVSSVAPKRYSEGWVFDEKYLDEINGTHSLAELYIKANKTYSGKVTVPILWDKENRNIVDNDSADIAMDLATNWLPLAKNKKDLVPDYLKEDIISFNKWLHINVNRKVYHVGFAKNQDTYDDASEVLFASLETLNSRLEKKCYLHGDEISLSDLFLIPTLVRFETIYEIHFKANKKNIKEFKHLYNYMLALMKVPEIRRTVDIQYSKIHYYFSHNHINPTRIIPAGPDIPW